MWMITLYMVLMKVEKVVDSLLARNVCEVEKNLMHPGNK